MIIAIAIVIALFFAMNIGGSGAAATMGIVYGTGAIRSKKYTLIICSIGIILGATFGSKAVIKTIGTGLIQASMLTDIYVIIILSSACISLFIANLIGIPLSTSEVTVGAVIGVGFIYKKIYIKSLIYIVMWWIITPVIAFLVVYSILTLFHKFKKNNTISFRLKKQYLIFFVIIAGFLEAISAGMNNVANAVGPLVGADFLTVESAMILGGVFIALGAFTLGGKVLDTNGKKITKISLHDGMIISLTGATITIIASIYGIPIPMTQVTTSAIVGAGVANQGKQVFQQNIFKKIMMVWLVSPFISFLIALFLVQLLVEQAIFLGIILSALCILLMILWSVKNNKWKDKIKQRSVIK